MGRSEIIKQISEMIHRFFPEAEGILYGSVARGTAHEGSDIDLLILMPDVGGRLNETKIRISERIYDIELETGANISPLILSKRVWEGLRTPFAANVRKEGIRI